jgi:hypothetical protein
VYHLRHLTMHMPGVDTVGTVVSLSLPILAAVVVLVAPPRIAAAARTDAPPTAERPRTPDTGLGRNT